MKKIGIMGGTFNPIHNAHLIMAQAALEQFDLDQVLFMPSKNPPHKSHDDIMSDEHRSRMIKLAIDGSEQFVFSDLELHRSGTTYTSDTLTILEEANPDVSYYFIMGGDSLSEIETWHEPEIIMRKCHILAARRGQLSKKDFKAKIAFLRDKYDAKISLIEMENIHISSKDIRGHIKRGESFAYYCPDKVMKYILYQGLYGLEPKTCNATIPEIHSVLKCRLRPKRFCHVLGVQYMAAALAMSCKADVAKAELAGALHDCSKYMSGQEEIDFCQQHDIEISDVERENTALLHAKIGMYFAKTQFCINDKDILNAIRYHTTGRENMSVLEMILQIADYIEPSRHMDCKPNSLESIRKKAFENLEDGLFMVLENQVDYLKQTDRMIDPSTMAAYDYYLERKKKNG